MTEVDLRQVQARWVLGHVTSNEVPVIAAEALAAGVDSPSLRLLAGESEPVMSEVAPLLDRAFRELGYVPLSREAAGHVIARHWSRRIVGGKITPFEGARKICSEVCEPLGDGDPWFAFKRLASEHEDYRFAAESAPPGTYDEKLRECERSIVREARRLIE